MDASTSRRQQIQTAQRRDQQAACAGLDQAPEVSHQHDNQPSGEEQQDFIDP